MVVSLITPQKAQKKLGETVQTLRLNLNLTQAGLSKRSGVPLPTLRKFEQKGIISLESFLKLLFVLDKLDNVVRAIEPDPQVFSSIDEVLKSNANKTRKRGQQS